MSKVTFFEPGAWGEYMAREANASTVVRIGDYIDISGQGGWDPDTLKIDEPLDEEAQMKLAFKNVDIMLRAAGADKGWGNVYKVRSYHAPLTDKTVDYSVAEMRKYCGDHKPTWTAIGVEKLALPGMLVEVEVKAYVGGEGSKKESK